MRAPLFPGAHWADDATCHFIQYAARRVAAMSLVLAVSYREEEIGPASPRWTSLVQLKRGPHVVNLPLHRLGAADAGRLLGALVPGLAPDLAGRIIERSAGSVAIAHGASRHAAAGRNITLPMPPAPGPDLRPGESRRARSVTGVSWPGAALR